jgi:CheY-like chemotaxis protein/two-component sensor histidine kinase
METSSPSPTQLQRRSIDQILKAGWYLLDLINEILDLALVESGKLSLSIESIALAEVLRECRAMTEPQALKRSISVSFPDVGIPYCIQADRTRIKQIIINLLSNAIKYNRAGGSVVVRCSLSSPERVRLSIEDSGEGLSPQQLSQLFQPFNRLGQELKREEGTGIGLVMTKRLAELMGGVIGVESVVGKGSVFWIELQLAAASQLVVSHQQPVPAIPAGDGAAPLRTLLYVEDNPANLMLVEDIMKRRPDIRLLTANDGPTGIEMARALLPDVILLDINLPGISGLQVLELLVADPATAHIPVIALSANAMPRDIERGLAAGFFRYLTKPIRIDHFLETLSIAMKSATIGPAA